MGVYFMTTYSHLSGTVYLIVFLCSGLWPKEYPLVVNQYSVVPTT